MLSAFAVYATRTRIEAPGQLNKSAEDHHVPDRLSDREAGGLLLAFLTVVILVIALATILFPTERASTDEQMDSPQSRLVDSITDTLHTRHA